MEKMNNQSEYKIKTNLSTKIKMKSKQTKGGKVHGIKSTMSHIRGLPPSANWSNKYSAIIFDNNLLYISNTFISSIDLIRKEFYQLFNSNQMETNEKLNVLVQINEDFILGVSSNLNFIIFQKYYNINNLEDKRIYFKERKEVLRFTEISSVQLSEKLETISIKTVKNLTDKNLLICGDNVGNIHVLKYTASKSIDQKSDPHINIRFLYSVSLGLLSSLNYITDINYFTLDESSILMVTTYVGEIVPFGFVNKENITKIQEVLDLNSDKKGIFSIDSLKINATSILLSLIDKNGSLFLFLFEEVKSSDGKINYRSRRILYDKNKFNDRSVEEKYVYFISKLVDINISEGILRILISSNKGKLYYLNCNLNYLNHTSINLSEDSEHSENLKYEEITDNPHSMVIFNILNFQDKLILFSADRTISVFKTPDLLFERDFITLGNKPKFLLMNNTSNKNIFLFNNDNHFLQYSYDKKNNGLACYIRKNLIKSTIKTKKKTSIQIVKCVQAHFNENVFAILQRREGKLESNDNNNCNSIDYSIIIYDYVSDCRINKLSCLKKNLIIEMMFYPSSRFFNNDITFSSFSTKNKEKLKNSINDLFSDSKIYNLLYIFDSSGVITIWDYIYCKFNQIKIEVYNVINSAWQFPIIDEFFFTVMQSKNDDLYINISNQICSTLIKKVHLEGCSNNLICDYYKSDDVNFLFFIENELNFKLNILDNKILKILETNVSQNYEEYKSFYSQFSKVNHRLTDEINFEQISNVPIKDLKVCKDNINSNILGAMRIQFLVSQIDNILKIFEIEYNKEFGLFKLVLKYTINAHMCKILEIIWINKDEIVSTSMDQSLKIWNLNMCKLINLSVNEKKVDIAKTVSENNGTLPSSILKLTNNFGKINSICLFQQSYKVSNEAINQFELFYSLLKENLNESFTVNNSFDRFSNNKDLLLFSLFKSSEINFEMGKRIILFELDCVLESTNISKNIQAFLNLLLYAKYFKLNIEEKYLETLALKFGEKFLFHGEIGICLTLNDLKNILCNNLNFEFLQNYPEIIKSKYFETINNSQYTEAINYLLNNNLFSEALVIYKLSQSTDFLLYATILDKMRNFLYSRQTFQAIKCQRINEILSDYFK